MQTVKKTLRQIDFFATSQLLRYAKHPRYATLTGSIFSIGLLIVFCALFINIGLMTLQKKLITSSSDSINQVDPSLTVIRTYPAGNFMFAACIQSMNLTQNRYFDLFLVVDTTVNGVNTQKSQRLQTCTPDYFPLDQHGNRLYRSFWGSCVCPPQNLTFSLQGTISSQNKTMLDLVVKKCDPTLVDSQLPCESEQSINQWEEQFSSYIIDLYFLNPLINPSIEQYLTNYIESRTFIVFSRKLSAYCYISVADFSITTDLNILPYTNNQIDTGTVIETSSIIFREEVSSSAPANATIYGMIYLIKSNKVTSYQRSFNKIDSFMSYIGGLAGALFSFLFFLHSYTNMSIELEIGGKLYRSNNSAKKEQSNLESKNNMKESFNLITYFIYLCYVVLRWLGYKHSSLESVSQYELYSQEVRKQIDIIFMFDRITFLEKAVQMMISEAQLDGLHLIERSTIEEGTAARQKYTLHEKVEQIYEQISEQKTLQTFQNNKGIEAKYVFQGSKMSPQGTSQEFSSPSLRMKDERLNSSNRTGMFGDNCNVSLENQDAVKEEIQNVDEESREIQRRIVDMMTKLRTSSQNGSFLSKNLLRHCSSIVKKLERAIVSSQLPSIHSKIHEQDRENKSKNIVINSTSPRKRTQCL